MRVDNVFARLRIGGVLDKSVSCEASTEHVSCQFLCPGFECSLLRTSKPTVWASRHIKAYSVAF